MQFNYVLSESEYLVGVLKHFLKSVLNYIFSVQHNDFVERLQHSPYTYDIIISELIYLLLELTHTDCDYVYFYYYYTYLLTPFSVLRSWK